MVRIRVHRVHASYENAWTNTASAMYIITARTSIPENHFNRKKIRRFIEFQTFSQLKCMLHSWLFTPTTIKFKAPSTNIMQLFFKKMSIGIGLQNIRKIPPIQHIIGSDYKIFFIYLFNHFLLHYLYKHRLKTLIWIYKRKGWLLHF